MRIGRRLPHLTDWMAVLIPLAAAPVLLFPRLEWMWIVAVAPLVWWLDRRNPLNLLLLALAGMVGVSVWATFDVRFSLGKLAGTVLGMLLFWSIGRLVRDDRRLGMALVGFLLAGCGLVAVALMGTAWLPKFPAISQISALLPVRLKGIPGAEEGFNPNAVGGTLALIVPFALTMVIYTLKRSSGSTHAKRVLAVLIFAALAAVLVITQSRGAWLGTAVGIGSLGLLTWWQPARWVAAFAAAIGSLAVYWLKPWQKFVAASDIPGQSEVSFAARVEIWSRAIYGIQDFPFTGMGMNAFRKVVHILYPLFTISPDADIASAHNHVLQAALDLGIPGMVAYLSLWFAVFVMLRRVWRQSKQALRRGAALGLFGGLVAYFVFQLTDAIPLGAKVGVFWWLAVGIAVSLFRIENPEFKRQARWWEVLLLWVLISLVSISFVGDHPYWALGIAVAGGTYLGWEVVRPRAERCGYKMI